MRALASLAAVIALVACSQQPASQAPSTTPAPAATVHRSDILFRRQDGLLTLWTVDGVQRTSAVSLGVVGPEWTLRGMGDFNGDGQTDYLWRRNDGIVSIWMMNGTTVASRDFIEGGPGSSWDVAGVGDYNGDGKADILFRNSAGQLSIWIMNGSTVVSRSVLGGIGTEWTVQ